MDNARGVHGHDRLGQTNSEPDELFSIKGTMRRNKVSQVPTLDVLRNQVGVIRVQVGVEILGRADAAYLLASLDLTPEAGAEDGIVGQFGSYEFQRDLTTIGILGEVDDTHSP